jgi:hypothetical protein
MSTGPDQMQHTILETLSAGAAPLAQERQDWWVFAEGAKLFAADRDDEAFQAFAHAAQNRIPDYALGLRLEVTGARKTERGVRVVGYWEESAFLRRVVVERDLGEIEPELAEEILADLKPNTPIAARLSGLQFGLAGEPVNLIVDVLASR